jgi:transcriptional/translational regulatory protein YebC/TACO1
VDVSGHWSTFIQSRAVTDYNEAMQDEIAALPGGEHVHRCWQCGSCTNSCTVNAINPEFNPRLHAAVEAAKKQSVYKDTIERAIAKDSGQDGKADSIETVVFEGFTPHRVPVLVECLTENNNRTAPEIRVLFRAGSMGSVAWMFDHVGLVEAHAPQGADPESAAIEAGADDLEILSPDDLEDLPPNAAAARFFTQPAELNNVTQALKSAGWTVTTTELSYRPKDYPELTDPQREEVTAFLQAIDDHSDVHRIHAAIR